ncbi:hypothetical protein DITRI_Ditri11bG0113700 [Diplodiscus trichospermus]
MGIIYLMQMLTVGFILLLAIPLVTSRTITTSKDEITCEDCTPIPYASPPPPVIECPPPPSPRSPPPPSPPPPRPSPPPPACPTCPPQPCNICEIPNTPVPLPPRPDGQQPGVIGGDVYPPPNGVVPYFPYGPPHSEVSAACSTQLGLKLVVSIFFLLLSAHFQLFLIN